MAYFDYGPSAQQRVLVVDERELEVLRAVLTNNRLRKDNKGVAAELKRAVEEAKESFR